MRGVNLGGVRDSRIGIVAHLLVKVVPLHVGVVREQILGGQIRPRDHGHALHLLKGHTVLVLLVSVRLVLRHLLCGHLHCHLLLGNWVPHRIHQWVY